MKVVYNERKAKELKEQLDVDFVFEHKKKMRKYGIKSIVFLILFSLGIFFFVWDLLGKGSIISLLGDGIVMLTGVISAFIFVHYAEVWEVESLDFQINAGAYRYPPAVVYMLLAEDNKILSFTKDDVDQIGVSRRVEINYKTPEGKVLHKSIKVTNIQRGMDSEEVLDLHSATLYIPYKTNEPDFTIIEEYNPFD